MAVLLLVVEVDCLLLGVVVKCEVLGCEVKYRAINNTTGANEARHGCI